MDFVVSLPMRDGNSASIKRCPPDLEVVSLPMRDGNAVIPEDELRGGVVVSLPMRDGNTFTSAGLATFIPGC